MLSLHEHPTVEEAGDALLPFALRPDNWLPSAKGPALLPAAYQSQVGPVRVAAAVQVTAEGEVQLRVSFRGPQLTPQKAADLLERFLAQHLPLTPNTEWRVEQDARRWVHFSRRYAATLLVA
jgi:hypothetical protein